MKRRDFITTTGVFAAGAMMSNPLNAMQMGQHSKMKIALVGTGVRGLGMWGKSLIQNYPNELEFVALCDNNPGRLSYAREYLELNCKGYTDYEKMIKETKPDTIIVTTVDSEHHHQIIKGLQLGCNIITEKPMTTDEVKCNEIIDAERKSGKKVTVGFNYRYGSYFTRIKELMVEDRIGKITSVDFHWYLNNYHGADYFRRWHAIKEKSGSLLVHKSSHHFDLVNWWLNSDPELVWGMGSLDWYGKNSSFRHTNCRTCPYKTECKYFMDITKDDHAMKLYVANENIDGYLRDACVFRNEINIYDKMSVNVKYANNAYLNYSLTTYSPYEGFRIAFNGTKGRIDAWEGIPWEMESGTVDQATLHTKEMSQKSKEAKVDYDTIIVSNNFGERDVIKVTRTKEGHGGGDKRLKDKLFLTPNSPDPLRHSAGTRDGAFSILVGIAARKSIENGMPVKINSLTNLVPQETRVM